MTCIRGSLMILPGLFAYFCLALSNILLSGWTTVCSSIHLLKGLSVASKSSSFGCYESRCCKHPYAGVCVDSRFFLECSFMWKNKQNKCVPQFYYYSKISQCLLSDLLIYMLLNKLSSCLSQK